MLNKILTTLFLSFLSGVDIDDDFRYQSNLTLAGIPFEVVGNGKSQNRYIWLHGDEETARMALEHHMQY